MTRLRRVAFRLVLGLLLAGSPGVVAHAGEPAPGDLAPDFALPALRFYDFDLAAREITRQNAGLLYEPVRLRAFQGRRPVLLIFISPTGSLGPARVEALERLHHVHGHRVQFLLVYTRGAPASSPEQRASATLLARSQLANSFVSDHALSIPCVVDTLDDATQQAYASGSGRLYLVASDGRIAFAGSPGLAGFDPAALEAALATELARSTDP